MKEMLKLTVLSCAVALSLTACDSDDENNPVQGARQATNDRDLQNETFRGVCSERPLAEIATGIATGGDAVVKSARRQYSFKGARIDHVTSVYATARCSGDELLQFREIGAMKIDEDSRAEDESKFMDISWNRLEVTALNDQGVLIANEVKLCGRTDWAEDKKANVTGEAKDLNCYRKQLPVQEKTVYRLDKGSLYWGDRGMLDAKTTRPRRSDMSTPYRSE